MRNASWFIGLTAEGRLWRGAVNGRETASSKLAELSAKSGKPVFAMNLQTREILEFVYPDTPAGGAAETKIEPPLCREGLGSWSPTDTVSLRLSASKTFR
jgi:hypothetical protein